MQKPSRILSDYKIITVGVTQQEIRENIKKNILVKPAPRGLGTRRPRFRCSPLHWHSAKPSSLKGIKHAVFRFHSSIDEGRGL